MAVQSSRFYSDNKGSQKSFYKKYCLWRGSWHYILWLCISAEAVSEIYPHIRTCFFCIDKYSVSQREWWIWTPRQSLRSCQHLSQTKQVLGNSCLEGPVTLCVQCTFQNLPKTFYTTTLPKMINTIFVIFTKSTLGAINNSHFHEDYVCG